MRVLITRPRKEAERVAEMLRERGHEPIVSPLMEIRFVDGPEIVLDGVQAILATSSNGIRALARRTSRRDVPIFAVGPQTTSAARSAGYLNIRTAQGDSLALAGAAREWAASSAGVLVHVAGRERSGDLARQLSEFGFQVRTESLYEATAADSLSREAITTLRAGTLDAVMLFSPRSARIFVQCAVRSHVEGSCQTLVACLISPAVGSALAPLSFREVRVAAQPNLDAMLPLLSQAKAHWPASG